MKNAKDEIFEKCILFRGMSKEETESSIRLMSGRYVHFRKNETVHAPFTPFTQFGLLVSGSVQVFCDDIDGNKMVMASVRPGISFGESLCFLKVENSPAYATASADSEVLFLSPGVLFDNDGPLEAELRKRFAALLADRTLSMNRRIQALSKLSVRQKILTYLGEMASESGSLAFAVPMGREDMASYLGLNRSSLSRELSEMKKDGLIDYRKNNFIIKQKK